MLRADSSETKYLLRVNLISKCERRQLLVCRHQLLSCGGLTTSRNNFYFVYVMLLRAEFVKGPIGATRSEQ